VERGEGAYIQTIEGHQLLDLHNCFSCNILGHNHPAVTEAITEFAPNGFCFGNPMEHEHKLAKILCERIESVEKVIFSCSGSEACLSAIRIARANTGKNKIAKFEGGYHGLGDEFLLSLHPDPALLAGPADRPLPVANSAGIPNYTAANVIVLPQNDLESCERILTENASDTAGVIMELQTGAGGVIDFDPDFVHGLRDVTQKLGILLIVDEVITLRAAFNGMQSLFGILPDLTVMGKIIGGGLPLGAVGGQEKYFRMHDEHLIYHSGTNHGHPLSTIAGIACMETMNKKAYKKLNDFGSRIKTELNEWADEKQYPFFVNGTGSHLGYEITDEPNRKYKSCRDMMTFSNEDNMQIFAFEMANQGIFPMYRGQIALSMSMSKKDIDSFINTSKEILDALYGNS
jgi:glutamate-1-semialdehyde 2,1-aminomutase